MEKSIRLKNYRLLLLIEIYLLFTFVLYLYGPLSYVRSTSTELVVFVIIYHSVFILGFFLGTNFFQLESRSYRYRFTFFNSFTILKLATFIYLIFGLIQLYQEFSSFNVSVILSKFTDAINNTGQLYKETLEASRTNEGSIFTQLQTLFSPLTFSVIPLGIINIKKNTNKLFVFFWTITILINSLVVLMSGTTLGIFRILITISVSYLIRKKDNDNKRNKTFLEKIIPYLGIFAILYFFNNNVTSRMSSIGFSIGTAQVDYENILLKYTPINMRNFIILVISYLSQGYQGMNIALNYEWESSFPIGSSVFLLNKLNFLHPGAEYKTLVVKMSGEWSDTMYWHTIYTWLANDLSFYGVIIIMFILGIFIALIYKNIFITKQTSSVVLFSLLSIMVIFIPMNNTVLSNPLTFMPFVTITLLVFLKNKLIIKK